MYLHKPRKCSLLYIWYSLLLICYKPVQHVTVVNTVGNCNTLLSIMIYYSLTGPLSYMSHVLCGNFQSEKIYNCHSYFVIRMEISPFNIVKLEVLFPYYILM